MRPFLLEYSIFLTDCSPPSAISKWTTNGYHIRNFSGKERELSLWFFCSMWDLVTSPCLFLGKSSPSFLVGTYIHASGVSFFVIDTFREAFTLVLNVTSAILAFSGYYPQKIHTCFERDTSSRIFLEKNKRYVDFRTFQQYRYKQVLTRLFCGPVLRKIIQNSKVREGERSREMKRQSPTIPCRPLIALGVLFFPLSQMPKDPRHSWFYPHGFIVG